MWAGLDLAALPKRPSAIVWGDSLSTLKWRVVYTDVEILASLSGMRMIWIDAPLSGGSEAFRACDRLLRKRGFSVLPLIWPAMQRLRLRAERLRDALKTQGATPAFFETFPWALYHAWGLRKKALPAIQAAFCRALGSSLVAGLPALVDVYDALAAWYMGFLYQIGQMEALSGSDGTLWVPKRCG